ncbi:hypothetical protein, partial [Clostridium faecium]
MEYKALLKDENLVKQYEYIAQKFDFNKRKFLINYFVYWCILKNIDARVCGTIILNYLVTLSSINIDEINILKELCSSVKNTIEKDKLLACEEENTYNEMSDIAFIVERKLKLDNKNCSSLGMGIKYEIKDLNNRLIT